ncbi:hypothetical protein BT69DRAFT_1301975 [Atractiella rhizophila]|nr:hypothetical protein BT69DRAFT_1301975 [Atractiella rhizophila]
MTDTGCIYNLRTLQVVDVGGSAIDIAMDGTERLAVLLFSSPQLAPNEKPRSLHTLSSSFYAITTLSRLIPVLTDSRFPDASQILEGEQIRSFAAGGGWDWIALDELTTVWDSKSKGEPVEFPYESDLQVKDVACGSDWVMILTWEGKVFKRDKGL